MFASTQSRSRSVDGCLFVLGTFPSPGGDTTKIVLASEYPDIASAGMPTLPKFGVGDPQNPPAIGEIRGP